MTALLESDRPTTLPAMADPASGPLTGIRRGMAQSGEYLSFRIGEEATWSSCAPSRSGQRRELHGSSAHRFISGIASLAAPPGSNAGARERMLILADIERLLGSCSVGLIEAGNALH